MIHMTGGAEETFFADFPLIRAFGQIRMGLAGGGTGTYLPEKGYKFFRLINSGMKGVNIGAVASTIIPPYL